MIVRRIDMTDFFIDPNMTNEQNRAFFEFYLSINHDKAYELRDYWTEQMNKSKNVLQFLDYVEKIRDLNQIINSFKD